MSIDAILFATVAAAEGGPAAALDTGGGPLVGRLQEQLHGMGAARTLVITRTGWARTVKDAVAHGPGEVEVVESADVAEDLRLLAQAARRGSGQLVLAPGDALVHAAALRWLLTEPRIPSGILGTSWPERDPRAFRTRNSRGRVLSAGSPYHRVDRPNSFFLGVVKVDPRLRPDVEAAALRAAAVLHEGPPAAWEHELERGRQEWREEREADDEQVRLWLRGAVEDPLSLLLVSLVRAGAQLGTANLREFFYARPRSGPELARAEQEMASIDEDRVALDSAVKAADGFFTTYFVSPYSRFIARFAARRGWTPNQMTTLSMAIGVLAAAAFAAGDRAGMIAGAVLLQAAFTVDCVDGQLARYTRTFSKAGAWLDSVFDRGKEYLVYAGLAIGAHSFGQDVWTLAAAALTLQTARHTVDFGFGIGLQETIATARHLPLEQPRDTPPSPHADSVTAEAAMSPAPAQGPVGGATAVAAPEIAPAATA
ncbi:MAG: CDP-alcohol phosphatidyltransferase family protein, partial [Actinomycetota bacterium]|nr:CDP-alcohol phosphatidyltransferase family protein [Actinomycetota bacterium]